MWFFNKLSLIKYSDQEKFDSERCAALFFIAKTLIKNEELYPQNISNLTAFHHSCCLNFTGIIRFSKFVDIINIVFLLDIILKNEIFGTEEEKRESIIEMEYCLLSNYIYRRIIDKKSISFIDNSLRFYKLLSMRVRILKNNKDFFYNNILYDEPDSQTGNHNDELYQEKYPPWVKKQNYKEKKFREMLFSDASEMIRIASQPSFTELIIISESDDLLANSTSKQIVEDGKSAHLVLYNILEYRIIQKQQNYELLNESDHVILNCTIAGSEQNESVRIWDSTFLVVDTMKYKSKLITATNISLYPEWTKINIGETLNFSLEFGPLPKGCTKFDLVEDIPESGGWIVRDIIRNSSDIYQVEF